MKNLKYTREQKLSCKLSDSDIALVRKLSNQGIFPTELARRFKVHRNSIYYWTNEKHNQNIKMRAHVWLKNNPRTREDDTLAHKRYAQRKINYFHPKFWIDARNNFEENLITKLENHLEKLPPNVIANL